MTYWASLQAKTVIAERFVEEQGYTPLPIDPTRIARDYDIDVEGKQLSGCYGCLMHYDSQFCIVYSTTLNNRGLINFTIAHELGHYFLPDHPRVLFPSGSGIHKSRSGFISSETHEREADHFAVGLLMPKKLFRCALCEAGSGFNAIKYLANLCRTSLTATAIRFATVADEPVSVLLSSDSKIDFCVCSESLGEVCNGWVLKGEPVPLDTATWGLHRFPEKIRMNSEEESCCSLAKWFDDAPDVEMLEDAIGLGGYEKVLTVLYAEELPEEDQS